MHTLAPNLTVVVAEEVHVGIPNLFAESASTDRLSPLEHAPSLDAALAETVARWSARTSDHLAQLPGGDRA